MLSLTTNNINKVFSQEDLFPSFLLSCAISTGARMYGELRGFFNPGGRLSHIANVTASDDREHPACFHNTHKGTSCSEYLKTLITALIFLARPRFSTSSMSKTRLLRAYLSLALFTSFAISLPAVPLSSPYLSLIKDTLALEQSQATNLSLPTY